MTTRDIFHRLRVGLALLVGFLVGKFLGEHFGHHASEFFIGGFLLGFLLTHALYWIIDRAFGDRAPL
ncbi:hypothetical protein ABZN20_12960 [Methylococcus sp. ANG]|uniref:hypothetical protein n=1 Tax=unclassified Methylococcus TaxID=2618889 RepID=UPI001C52A870|nr:hypothetical protein [Methylococcus sp. Mc7]QXP85376.1 hypothetical protein KW115_06545 [Methylococcus sp. Mc7]